MDGEFLVDYLSIFIITTIVGILGALNSDENTSLKRALIERISTHGIIGIITYAAIEGIAPDINPHLEYAIILAVALFGIDKAIEKVKKIFEIAKKP